MLGIPCQTKKGHTCERTYRMHSNVSTKLNERENLQENRDDVKKNHATIASRSRKRKTGTSKLDIDRDASDVDETV